MHLYEAKWNAVKIAGIVRKGLFCVYSYPAGYEDQPAHWTVYSMSSVFPGEDQSVDVSYKFDAPGEYVICGGFFQGTNLEHLLYKESYTITVSEEETLLYTEGSIPQEHDPYKRAAIGNCQGWMDVHSSPGEDASVVGKAYPDDSIALLEWSGDGDWCKVIYNNGNDLGWVYRGYIVPVN